MNRNDFGVFFGKTHAAFPVLNADNSKLTRISEFAGNCRESYNPAH